MEEQLREAGERTQFYMNQMPLAFIAWDRDFRVSEWNPAAEKIFGWSASVAVGRHANELIVPPDIQPAVNQIWQEIISGSSLVSHSIIPDNLTKDGRRITCEWRNTPWRDAAGQICGFLFHRRRHHRTDSERKTAQRTGGPVAPIAKMGGHRPVVRRHRA